MDVPTEVAPAAVSTIFTTIALGAKIPANITAKVVRAASQVLLDHPSLNGTREGATFAPSPSAQVAVAIQTDGELLSPVVRDPAAKSVDEVANELRDLAARARTHSLSSLDLEGATFSVTNLGGWGVDGFTPSIDPTQVAALGIGAARRVPVVAADGSLAVAVQLTLSLAFDPAFVACGPAASFLQQLASTLSG